MIGGRHKLLMTNALRFAEAPNCLRLTGPVKCMDALAKLLPPEKTYRMPLAEAKDVGELYQQREAEKAAKQGKR